MMRLYLEIRSALKLPQLRSMSYYRLKRVEGANEYQSIKNVLRSEGAPLQGWLVSGREWEDFEVENNRLGSE
ncbi:hypothetical protein FRC12_011577 [Ceratobasidium sp. 428]|nr:hypothetical protein FRC12_011577 [Ceratobasidium sp. 428]